MLQRCSLGTVGGVAAKAVIYSWQMRSSNIDAVINGVWNKTMTELSAVPGDGQCCQHCSGCFDVAQQNHTDSQHTNFTQ